MKTLLLLRHAKSSWKHPDLSDHDRPLNKRGKEQGPEMGRLLRQQELTPDLILSSTAKRALETAKAAAENCGYDGEVELIGDFYPGTPSDYIYVLSLLPDNAQRVMVVGHNPGLEELLETLTGEFETLATAALAQVEIQIENWGELDDEPRGKLAHLWEPTA